MTNLLVSVGKLDLRPSHRIHFDHVVCEAVVVEDSAHLNGTELKVQLHNKALDFTARARTTVEVRSNKIN